MTGEAEGRPLAPVVGMVGAGQLARMTCQAAIGLGIGFRVLAGSARDSAAQVCADVQVGDYTRLEDLLAFAGGCDVVTFDHEHVPAEHLAELERAVAVRPGGGRAPPYPGQAGDAGAADRASACPARVTRRSPTWPG